MSRYAHRRRRHHIRSASVAVGAAALVTLSTIGGAVASAAEPTPTDPRSYPGCPLLLEGMTHECVQRLQRDLNDVDEAYALPGTRFFGELTRKAVLDFQSDYGIDADGNVGADTADLLQDLATRDGAVSSPRPGQPLPPEDPESDIPAERCAPEEFASLDAYLSGDADPPRCFAEDYYEPEIEETTAGVRALDPYDDGCSGPTPFDRFPAMYDFRDACAAHDYAYDLIRYGVDTFSKFDADNQLYEDWVADCESRARQAALFCGTEAAEWRAGVSFGPVRPGETIDTE